MAAARRNPAARHNPAHRCNPAALGSPADPGNSAGSGNPARSGNPADRVDRARRGNPADPKSSDRGRPAYRGSPPVPAQSATLAATDPQAGVLASTPPLPRDNARPPDGTGPLAAIALPDKAGRPAGRDKTAGSAAPDLPRSPAARPKTSARTDKAASPDTHSDRAERVVAQARPDRVSALARADRVAAQVWAEQLADQAQAYQAVTPQSPVAAGPAIAFRARARARQVSCGRRADAWMPSRLLTAPFPTGQTGGLVATSSARAGINRKVGEPHLPQAGNPAELAEDRDYIR